MGLDQHVVKAIVARALAEDIGSGDVTSEALVPEATMIRGVMISRSRGVVAGLSVAEEVFRQVCRDIDFKGLVTDGERVEPGTRIAEIAGDGRGVLAGERVALNFMQRLSGIATLARRCVDAVGGYDCRILDTRKTTPCLRVLEKYAVRVGGGHNHRTGLYDQVLIKDNHLRALLPEAGDLNAAVELGVRRARERVGDAMRVEVEVENVSMVEAALKSGADIIMLDNMSDDAMRRACTAVRAHRAATGRDRPITEASGGVTLDRLALVAATGVDAISLGMLTHSAPALDLAMETA